MSNAPSFLTDEEVKLLRRERCADLTDDQFRVFLHAIDRYRLDPFANQIYAVSRNMNTGTREKPKWEKRMTVQTGIDGFRLIADRTGQYAGNDDPVYDNEKDPKKATVTVYKIVGNLRCPFTASARWDQYYPGDVQGKMWRRMPHLMLGKAAESLALRKAFPAELSGIYTTEEMQQADARELGDAPESTVPPSEPHPRANGKGTNGKPSGEQPPPASQKKWDDMTEDERFVATKKAIIKSREDNARLEELQTVIPQKGFEAEHQAELLRLIEGLWVIEDWAPHDLPPNKRISQITDSLGKAGSYKEIRSVKYALPFVFTDAKAIANIISICEETLKSDPETANA